MYWCVTESLSGCFRDNPPLLLPERQDNDSRRRPLLVVNDLGVEVVNLDVKGSLQCINHLFHVLRKLCEGSGRGLEEAGHGEDETGGLLAVLGRDCSERWECGERVALVEKIGCALLGSP